jgi:hypothetical protein
MKEEKWELLRGVEWSVSFWCLIHYYYYVNSAKVVGFLERKVRGMIKQRDYKKELDVSKVDK